MKKKNKKTIALYLLPAMLMVIVILYLPIFINLYESLFNWGALSSRHEFVGLGNYIKMFKDETFYVALKNNLIFTVMSVFFQIGVSLVIASVLESKFMRKTQGIFRTIYFIPSLLMVTVVGITFKMMYSPSIGIINPLLEMLGISTAKISSGKCRKCYICHSCNVSVAIYRVYSDIVYCSYTKCIRRYL